MVPEARGMQLPSTTRQKALSAGKQIALRLLYKHSTIRKGSSMCNQREGPGEIRAATHEALRLPEEVEAAL